jgi:hypothetical protein
MVNARSQILNKEEFFEYYICEHPRPEIPHEEICNYRGIT